jgi:hypothetical protein
VLPIEGLANVISHTLEIGFDFATLPVVRHGQNENLVDGGKIDRWRGRR